MANALVLVVPGLLALPTKALAMRSLAGLARYADPPRHEPAGIVAALFATLGMAPATPVAPLALLGAGGDPGDDYLLCADPVHLAANRDTVVLVQVIHDLAQADAETLIRMLDRHFADDGLRFEAVRPSAWFARRRQPADLVTTPPDAARGRKLIANLPRGADSGTWKRWQNEIEMLLHEHPVNAAREAAGVPAANALWFWGGGRMADVGFVPSAIVGAVQTRVGDVARGIARRAGSERAPMDADLGQLLSEANALDRETGRAAGFVLAVLPPLRNEVGAIEGRWLAPALELLAARRISELHLVADGNGAAATWTARAPTFWQRLTARASRRVFDIPPPPDA